MTPFSIQRLIKDLIGHLQVQSLTELCCGTAVMGLNLWERLSHRNPEVSFYGTDIDATLCGIAKINLFLCEIRKGEIQQKDLLAMPSYAPMELSDMIVMDIPRGNNVTEFYDSRDFRLINFNKKIIYSDWIFIQDVLYRLDEKGCAAILVTTGALIRMNEKILREQIVLNDWLEAVITLPPNLYPKERTGTELLIINKNKSVCRRRKIIFIDISSYYYRVQRNAYSISDEGHEIAFKCYRYGKEIEGVCTVKETDKLDSNACSFKSIQYIHHKSETAIKSNIMLEDIAMIVRGSQTMKKNVSEEGGKACFINIKDIQGKRIQFDTADSIGPEHPAYRNKFQIQEDDILITSRGTAMKMAVVEKNPPMAFISGNITLIRVDKEKYDPYVLLEYLDGKQGRMALERIQSGTTIKILSNASLKKLKVPEYNLEFMKKIGGQLKEKQWKFYEEQKRVVDTYQEERDLLLKELSEA